MDKNSVDWRGSMPAIVTPFDAKGNIDEAKFRTHIENQIGLGATGVVVSGCTGEFWALSMEERKRLFKVAVEVSRGRINVIAGTGTIRTQDVIELTTSAKDSGCAGAMIMPPYFVKPSTADIIAHYETISDAVKFPIMLYNIPSYNQTPLTPELVDRLANIECVVAIKESSMDFNIFYKTILVAGDRLRVFCGPAGLFGMAAIEVGSPGYVEAFPNFWPEAEAHQFCEIVKSGDQATVQRVQKRALQLSELMSTNGRNYYTSVKTAMNILGLPGGFPRRPLTLLGEPHVSQIKQGLAELGVRKVAAAAE
ncbi:MAG: 4-hydroxy-tetrahydrodipicolinate synthase [Rhodospirillales bacterium]|nr:4-hydroxy-tetrahydrodipicolinate synthase [Rhodospirillales bacterium]